MGLKGVWSTITPHFWKFIGWMPPSYPLKGVTFSKSMISTRWTPGTSFNKGAHKLQLCLGYNPSGVITQFITGKRSCPNSYWKTFSGFFGCEIQSGKAIGMNFKPRNPCQNFFMLTFLFDFFCLHFLVIFVEGIQPLAAKAKKLRALKGSAGSFEPTESTGFRFSGC